MKKVGLDPFLICLCVFILLNIFVSKLNAFLIGNPGISFDSTEQTNEVGYQNSTHKVMSNYFHPNRFFREEVKFNENILYLQTHKKVIDRVLFLFLHAGLSAGISLSKNLGFGAQISFPTDYFSTNFTRSWDWNADVFEGSRTEGLTAFWLAVPLERKFFLYSGVLKLQTTSHFSLDRNTGGFFGAQLLNENNYDVAFEINSIRKSINISFGYSF